MHCSTKFHLMWQCLQMKRSTGVVCTIVMCRSRPLQTEFTNDLRCTQTQTLAHSLTHSLTHRHTTWFEHFMRWHFFFWVTYVTPKLMTVEYLMEIYGEFVQNFWQLFTLFVFVFVDWVCMWKCVSVPFLPFRHSAFLEMCVCGFDLRLKN